MNAIGCASEAKEQEALLHAVTRNAVASPVGEWAQRIAHLYQQGAPRTLELARLVMEARRSLHRGEWGALWKSGSVPFSKRKGDMLVCIAKKLGDLPNEQTSAYLPQGWNILYELAQLDRATLEMHILDSVVHPRLSLQGARKLVGQFRGKSSTHSKQANVKNWLGRLRKFVDRTLAQWSEEERAEARVELEKLGSRIMTRDRTGAAERGHY